MSTNAKIEEFSSKWAADFAMLNYEWIEKYFTVESHDREILDDPQKWVIEPGGHIFMAVVDGNAAGAVALIPAGEMVMELTKMAVSPAFHGQGIGDRLMVSCIALACRKGISTIFLESHRRLATALRLYRRHGFVEVPRDPHSQYARVDIRMELAIKQASG